MHEDPLFFETTYADIPFERFFLPEHMEDIPKDQVREKEKTHVLSEGELDKFIDDLLDSPDLEITPPDMLVSATYRW